MSTPVADAALKSIDALTAKHTEQMSALKDSLDSALKPGTHVTTDLRDKVVGLFAAAQKGWETEAQAAYANIEKAKPEGAEPAKVETKGKH